MQPARIAVHFLEERIKPDRWRLMDDEAVIEELVEGRAIGRWTAEMFPGSRWQPWRSVASRYLWRSLAPLPMEL